MNVEHNEGRFLSEEVVTNVLSFWFGDLKKGEMPEEKKRRQWWVKDPAVDNIIKEEFQGALLAAENIEPGEISLNPRQSLTLIIILDQFSRNIYRDKPKAFSQDALALRIALKGIEAGLDLGLHPFERIFYYMPLMHSEDRNIQGLSLECFNRLVADYPEPPELHEKLLGSKDYAQKHALVIERFGRYPHRNKILGRESTGEELEFLSEPGSSF